MEILKIIFFILVLVLSIPHIFYRFKHPEKTETQRFLEFPEAYKEFFGYSGRFDLNPSSRNR
jgi:hypothetical protein